MWTLTTSNQVVFLKVLRPRSHGGFQSRKHAYSVLSALKNPHGKCAEITDVTYFRTNFSDTDFAIHDAENLVWIL